MPADDCSSSSPSHAAPNFVLDGGSDNQFPSSTALDSGDALVSDQGFEADISEDEKNSLAARSSRSPGKSRRGIKRSMSDKIVRTQSTDKTRGTTQSNEEAQVKSSEARQFSHASLRIHRPIALRALISSTVETRSHYHDPAIATADLQRELVAQTTRVDQQPSESRRVQPTCSKSGPSNEPNTENSALAFRWYARTKSSRNSSTSELTTPPQPHNPDVPLIPCLKPKAKSTTTSPPGELQSSAEEHVGDRILRRMKTVDFEKATKSLIALPESLEAPGTSPWLISQVNSLPTASSRPTKTGVAVSSCPNPLSTGKSSLADPATTHTDVHVIAIAPSRNVSNAVTKASSDPATPTMQFVESNNGCYEVIWDDVPKQESDQTRRRSSVASHSLQLASPTAARGLQRVNSKLTDWSGSWNAPSDTFKPTIVVFPDHDTRIPHFESAVEDDDDILAQAPPNSHRTSAVPSRVPSQPVSAPLTRAPSEEEIPLVDTLHETPLREKHGWVVPLEDALMVPDPDMQSTRLLNATRRLRSIPAIRKLSNIDDSDVKFRGHRDSVTLAHTRLLRTGGVSPELFAHRDSVSMARKRMHAKNHAISAAREIPMSKPKDYVPPLPMSLDDTVLDMPLVKQHAAQALRSQKSASMLAPQRTESNRHIQIVE